MNLRSPFRNFEPTFFSGLLDDPVLLVRIRPLGRSLLVDCGQLHHLAKREIKSVSAIFISHAHMDHFMGMDTFIRNVHVSPHTFDVFGPPGIADRLAHKLAGYEWNLSENFWCSFRVSEIGEDAISTYLLSGPGGFACRFEKRRPRSAVIYENRYLSVEAALGDHKIPVLMFRFTEKPGFSVDEAKLQALGLVKGPWLKDLKRGFYKDWSETPEITVVHRVGERIEETRAEAPELYERIRGGSRQASIGYITDIGLNDKNLSTVDELLRGVTLLICECTYLEAEREKARRSYHLCTADLNLLAGRLRPGYLMPMHLSKLYQGRSREVYRQLHLPPETELLCLPEHRTPRPLLSSEIPPPAEGNLPE